jgi:hypothetical protein
VYGHADSRVRRDEARVLFIPVVDATVIVIVIFINKLGMRRTRLTCIYIVLQYELTVE